MLTQKALQGCLAYCLLGLEEPASSHRSFRLEYTCVGTGQCYAKCLVCLRMARVSVELSVLNRSSNSLWHGTYTRDIPKRHESDR